MLAILHACGFANVQRIERIRLVPVESKSTTTLDTMTECLYTATGPEWPRIEPPLVTVKSVGHLEKANDRLSLGFDAQDLKYYQHLFFDILKRAPTQLELMDLAQSNSEHSRHWFFKGILHDKDGQILLDGRSLFDLIKDTQRTSSNASKSAFCDNASALEGFTTPYLYVDEHLQYATRNQRLHPTFTAETHNFPTSVAPFEGATTGVGGRLRDQHAIGRGGLVMAGTVGYAVAGLFGGRNYRLTRAARMLIEASNGVSDYANKFGEPLINGFCRSYEHRRPSEDWGQSSNPRPSEDWGQSSNPRPSEDWGQSSNPRPSDWGQSSNPRPSDWGRAWHKPILFSGGVGQVFDDHIHKQAPEQGDRVVKLGGPAYRIGVGGGTASSRTHNVANRNADLAAVQRGDAEMENKLNRVIRTCVERGETNPIRSIHDQGAGGTANVTKEIVYPLGATIHLERVALGDQSMTPQEVWISEYQEQDTVLVRPEHTETLSLVCQREDVPMAVIGTVEPSKRIHVVHGDTTLIDLPLEAVVGEDMPQKHYTLRPYPRLSLPCDNQTCGNTHLGTDLLFKLFGKLCVGSKRFLTSKIDRSVGGLVAQQPCVGPFQTPLADFGLVAQSPFGHTGIATANGERPTIGLTHPARMARMAIGEMLTNLMFVKVRDLKDVRCAGNWMWPLTGDGKEAERQALHDACVAMCSTLCTLGVALDGGKDSLSMSYTDQEGKTIKAPRQLVISGYAAVPDIRVKVTPDLKAAGNTLVFVHLADEHHARVGGSVGCATLDSSCRCEPPDLDNPQRLASVFRLVQGLLHEPGVIVAGHDRSDGGLVTTLCEMAMGGNLGLRVNLPNVSGVSAWQQLITEELGFVLEVAPQHAKRVATVLGGQIIGQVTTTAHVTILTNDELRFHAPLHRIRKAWEMTSMRLEHTQTDREAVHQEYANLLWHKDAKGHLDIDAFSTVPVPQLLQNTAALKPRVAILREQGSNGDREMAAAFMMAGFETVDVSMRDLYGLDDPSLDSFQGIAFVGGFSYADVGGSAFGWQRMIESNAHLRHAFEVFRKRPDTFSLGVCNGCQLMVRLGWVPAASLLPNASGRFESRFVQVCVPHHTNAILLEGMQGANLGVWVAHGEGRFALHDTETTPCLTYTDSAYPFNPNGSERDTAALCSADGRHIAMMPHPERSTLPWQWPLYAKQVPHYRNTFTPWHRVFENAYRWCVSVK